MDAAGQAVSKPKPGTSGVWAFLPEDIKALITRRVDAMDRRYQRKN